MFVVIAGTNRPDSNSLKVARLVEACVQSAGAQAQLMSLVDLPPELFRPEAYAAKPAAFAPFQAAIDGCSGVLVVVPEYNGGFPGALKYFIDMLRFPGSLQGVPSGFVGISAGMWGGLRAVEQLQMVFQYRFAHLYPRRVFLPTIHEKLDDAGQLRDADLATRLQTMVSGFVDYATALPNREGRS